MHPDPSGQRGSRRHGLKHEVRPHRDLQKQVKLTKKACNAWTMSIGHRLGSPDLPHETNSVVNIFPLKPTIIGEKFTENQC